MQGNCRSKPGKKTLFKAFCEVHKKTHLMPSDNPSNMIALKVKKSIFVFFPCHTTSFILLNYFLATYIIYTGFI